jgi:hypothetical protein
MGLRLGMDRIEFIPSAAFQNSDFEMKSTIQSTPLHSTFTIEFYVGAKSWMRL